ncbi:hypothetical protein [Bdellovibrio bacteriovorus]|uniref:hypothetical protein n=1 Tax=Bdellovibrio bacteriovorus TaxID=959 RepID=UPI0035A67442
MRLNQYAYIGSISDSIELSAFVQQALDSHHTVELHNFDFTSPVELIINSPNADLSIRDCLKTHNLKIKNSTLKNLSFLCDFENQNLEICDVNVSESISTNSSSRSLAGFHLKSTTNTHSVKNLTLYGQGHLEELEVQGYTINKIGLYLLSRNTNLTDCNLTFEEQLFQNTSNSISIIRTTFTEDIIKSQITFPKLDFESVTFNKKFELSGCNLKDTKFRSLTCNGTPAMKIVHGGISGILEINNFIGDNIYLRARFGEAKILNTNHKALQIQATDAVFSSELEISDSDFKALTLSREGTTDGLSSLHLKSVKLERLTMTNLKISGRTRVHSCTIGDFNANYAQFLEQTSFDDTKFLKAPHFFESKLFPDTNFRGSDFKGVDAAAEGRFRKLKHHMKTIENDRDEAVFSSLELHSRTKGLKWTNHFEEKVLGYAYLMANKFGRSIILPGVWLLLLFALGTVVYLQPNAISFSPPSLSHPLFDSWYFDVQSMCPGLQAALFSFFNSLGPVRLLTGLNIFIPGSFEIVAFSWFQLVLSSILWYLFIVGIRRRFRTT